GDHLKSADEIGLPLFSVGLAYRQGYFHQYLNADGWQQEVYPENDFVNMPMTLQVKEDGSPITIEVELPGRMLHARIWKLQVGKNPLYLLDADVESNSPEDREITAQLYGGDTEMRIKQEILLGVGGLRALRKLNIEPTVFHMNEGHSAFLAVERIRELVEEKGLSFDEAREVVQASNVFTTHTPVPAGLDKFQTDLVDKYLSHYYAEIGISREEFMALGYTDDAHNSFGMANLAISLSSSVNGVSKLHGEVSKKMWKSTWPDVPEEDIPIQHVTNGIHTRSWISDELTRLYERYLGPMWFEDPLNKDIWKRVDKIPATELWRSQVRLKERLVAFARYRLRLELKRIGAPKFEVKRAEEVLDPEALTICFARRFATYKRATLIFKDPDRLAKILNNEDCPVQIIFAGKAHPKDNEGKEYIRQINHLLRDDRFRNRLMFIEDYDINIARYMVQGADIWLNTPRRPLEASGTSGMKAAANAGLNLSVLDGWWCEGYDGNNGWAIGAGEMYDDLDLQDEVESNALYDLLEQEIVPLYYRKGSDGLSRGWIERMKDTLKSLGPVFNTNRMVIEYTEKLYFPSYTCHQKRLTNDFATAKALVSWKKQIRTEWKNISVKDIHYDENAEFIVGAEVEIKASIALGALKPEEVSVELYYGHIDVNGELANRKIENMICLDAQQNGVYQFSGRISCTQSGQHGFAIRILPKHEDVLNVFNMGLIYWS
ncbi:MAG: alpha-glucan family phosphorylase, partial [Spirochaetota bacterium]|nr:alpha-glucan family phosphorylase [Spirochaetota bacterium]